MKSFKSYFYALLVLTIISFSFVRTQQMDIYREIARSQQQIMTVYKYLLTEYIHELDVTELTTRIIDSMLSNFDPYTEYYQEEDLEDLTVEQFVCLIGLHQQLKFNFKAFTFKGTFLCLCNI